MKWQQLLWKAGLGMGISALCLILVFHNIRPNELKYHLRQTSLPLMLGGLLLFAIYLVVTAHRWRLLLTSVFSSSLGDSLTYILIGRLVNNIFPLRAGEVVKAFLLGRKKNVSKSAVFATVITDRLLDTSSLLIFVVILFIAIDVPLSVKRSALFLGAAVLVAATVLSVLAREQGDPVQAIRHISAIVPDHLWKRIVSLSTSFSTGLQALRKSKLLLAVILYSILAWSLVVLSAWFFLKAVDLHLTWYVPLFLVVVTNIGGVLPASPGSMGVFHALVVYSLSLWAVDKEIALTMSVIYHESTYLLITILGLLTLWREGYSLVQVQRLQASQIAQQEQTSSSHSSECT